MRKAVQILFLMFVALLCPHSLQANYFENIRFSSLTIQQNLSHNGINSIIEDYKGYIWIGTRNGLNKYDGLLTSHYFTINNDSTSINHNFIKKLYEDKNHNLWIGTENGICRYNREKDLFVRYSIDGKLDYVVNEIIQTKKGDLVISSSKGYYIYQPETNSFISFKAFREPANIANDITEDSKGILWIATSKGVRCLNTGNNMVEDLLPESEYSTELKTRPVHSIFIDKKGVIWFGGWSGLYKYNPSTAQITKPLLSMTQKSGIVRCIATDDYENLWIGSENGIYIISNDGMNIRHISQGIGDTSRINDNAVYAIRKDRNGNMWIGSYFGGVNILFKQITNFSCYFYGYSDRHLSGKAVRQIIEGDNQSLWIATEDGGLNYLDREMKTFRHYQKKTDAIPLNYHNVHTLLKTKKGDLWIGTFSGGVNKYNLNTKRMEYLSCMKKNKESSLIFCLAEDSDNDIWIGTADGLFFVKNGEQTPQLLDKKELSNAFIYALAHDGSTIWIGTRRDGLFKYDKSNGLLTKIESENASQDFVTSIYIDQERQLWVGTNGGGIRHYNPLQKKFSTYTNADGLSSNSIMGIVQDDDKNRWISTDHGLCRFDNKTKQFSTYTINDGLPINQFNFCSAFKASDGELYFGTINGMISFYPQNISRTRDKLPIEITEFKIKGKEVRVDASGSPLSSPISETPKIVLTHEESSLFGFSFTALNFSHTESIQYAIKMEGADKEWQKIGNQHQILFSNLPHGNYRLKIKASYDGVTWDEQNMRSLDITILAPWYHTWCAYILYAVTSCGLVLVILLMLWGKMKMKQQIRQEQLTKGHAEEMNKQKMNFFTNISHDLKTPLTLILGPLQKIREDKNVDSKTKESLRLVMQNAQRMRNLVDELLMLSKIEMGHINKTLQKGDILDFTDRICDIFRLFASNNGVNFIVNIIGKHTPVYFSSLNIERILYNLLSNAFKFTPAEGTIQLTAQIVEKEGKKLFCITVKDTGVGIPEHLKQKIFDNYYSGGVHNREESTGIGLALTKSLIELHHGSISVESTKQLGSTFHVELSVDRNDYTDEEVSEISIENDSSINESYILEKNNFLEQARKEVLQDRDKRFSILIVEDNNELSEFLKQIFVEEYDVLTAYNGKEGYKMAHEKMPDIIISDVMMPEMNGYEMSRSLKSNIATSHIPIVLLTARVQDSDKIEGFESGADAYIEKPFNFQRLELQVKNMINTRCSNIQRFKNDSEIDIAPLLTQSPKDEEFLNKVMNLTLQNMSNENFYIKDITDEMGMSRSLLHIKMKNLTGFSTTEFIRNIKMKEAREKLLSGMNVSETSFAVGISDPNYFSKCFKKQFGQTPSEFIKQIQP